MITNLVATVTLLTQVVNTTNFSTHEQWDSEKFNRYSITNAFEAYDMPKSNFIYQVQDENPKWRDEITTTSQITVYHFEGLGELTTTQTVYSTTNHYAYRWIQTQ